MVALAVYVDPHVLTTINGALALAVSSAPILTAEIAEAPSAWLAFVVWPHSTA